MLRIEHISKKYGDNLVLDDISFNVNRGDVLAIIGGSGSGKSTLLRCISMLDSVSSGNIYLDDLDISTINNYHQRVGMVFQQFNLFNNLSVIDNIILAPCKLRLMTRDDAVKRARELLKDVGLLEKENSYPRNLSGGERQRVAIVRTLIMNPDIILFDEPTSSLDPKMTKDVLDLIRRLVFSGMTIILVSHELKFVREVAKRVIFIHDGHVAYDGDSSLAFNNPKNKDLCEFIGSMM